MPLVGRGFGKRSLKVLHQVEDHEALLNELPRVLLQPCLLSLDLALPGLNLCGFALDYLCRELTPQSLVEQTEEVIVIPVILGLEPAALSLEVVLLVVVGRGQDLLHPLSEVFRETEASQDFLKLLCHSLFPHARCLGTTPSPGMIGIVVGVPFALIGRHYTLALATPQKAPIDVKLFPLRMRVSLLAEDFLDSVKHVPVNDRLMLALYPIPKFVLVGDVFGLLEGPYNIADDDRIPQQDGEGRNRDPPAFPRSQAFGIELFRKRELGLHARGIKIEGPPGEPCLIFVRAQQVLRAPEAQRRVTRRVEAAVKAALKGSPGLLLKVVNAAAGEGDLNDPEGPFITGRVLVYRFAALGKMYGQEVAGQRVQVYYALEVAAESLDVQDHQMPYLILADEIDHTPELPTFLFLIATLND